MNWVDIVVVVILILSFFGGLKEGAVKNFFSLAALLIAIPIAGRFYYLITNILAFLPGTNWEDFVSFFIALGIISVILHIIFLIPRKIVQKIWGKGGLFRLLGGVIGIFNTGIGLVLLTLALRAYPIISWLEENVANSSVLTWLVETLTFIQSMLPEVLQQAGTIV